MIYLKICMIHTNNNLYEFFYVRKDNDMNTDYIRSLLIMFNNRSEYEIETALAIYEYMDKDIKDITNEEIFKVHELVHSQDDVFNDYIKEEVIKIKEESERKNKLIEEKQKEEKEIQQEKDQDEIEK